MKLSRTTILITIGYMIFLAAFETGSTDIRRSVIKVAMSTIVFLIVYLLAGKLFRKFGFIKEEISPIQTASVELNLNWDSAFDKCVNSLIRFGAKIESDSKARPEIKATTKVNWRSWGEQITLRLVEVADHKVRIDISSTPRFEATVYDGGKGRRNVEEIVGYLRQSH